MVAYLLELSYTLVTVLLLYLFLKKSLTSDFSFKKNISWWILFGFIFNFISFSWLYSVYPLIWLPEGFVQMLGIFILQLILSVTSGLCFFIVGYGLTAIKKYSVKKIYHPLIFAITLMFAEVFRSLAISLLYYGENTTVNLHFTSGTLGNALSTTPLIEFAYFGGVFSLTFVLGYLVYSAITQEHRRTYWKHMLTCIVLLVLTHYMLPTYGPAQPTKVAVITTNFPIPKDEAVENYFLEQNDKVHKMTLSLAQLQPDIIVYPEDTRYLVYLPSEEREALSTTFPTTLIIDGITTRIDNKSANASFLYSTQRKKATQWGKSLLLPFNEYIPYVFRYAFSFFVPEENLGTYIQNHTYTPVYSQKTTVFNGLRVGTLICSEILSYKTIQNLKKEGPSLVFFQSHLNVFHDNPLFRIHLYSFTKVAAAQLRRPLISSTNGAPSLLVSAHGKIISAIPTGFSVSIYTFLR
jgi:apolipoprotein N-acyltransferase